MRQLTAQSLSKQQGFILVASIWIMAILVLLVSAFAVWVETSLNKALIQNERANMQLNATSTQSVLLYIAATQSASPGGITIPDDPSELGEQSSMSLEDFFANNAVDDMGARALTIEGTEISVDDTIYNGIGGSLFSVLDLSGLIPLNSRSTAHVEALLSYINIEQARRSRLSMTLQDYIDKDEVIGINGAEKFQYLQSALTPPPNAELLSRNELRRVMGWNTLSDLWNNQDLLSAISATATVPYNVNAMPQIVAEIAFELSPADAAILVDERKEKKYTRVKELMDRTGLDLFNHFNDIKFTPSDHFRFSFWYPNARLKREIDVYFLPIVNAGDTPWIINRDLIVPILESDTVVKPREVKTHLFR